MLKLRNVLLVIVAMSLVGVMAGAASGQADPNQVDTNNARNNPCRAPWVSLAVSVVKTVGSTPGRAADSGADGASGECNPALYNNGNWHSYRELLGYVRLQQPVYAYDKMLNAGSIVVVGSFVGKNGDNIILLKKGGAYLGVDTGRLVNENRGWIVSHSGGTLTSTIGGNILVNGGGSLMSGADVISQGGGNLITSDGAGVIAAGGGNLGATGTGIAPKVLQSTTGDTLFQLPNRYAVVHGPQQTAMQPPLRPSTPSGSSGRSDTQILVCINSPSGVQNALRASHVSVTVTSGTAYFSGTFPDVSSRNAFLNAVTNPSTSCGARAVNSSNLAVRR